MPNEKILMPKLGESVTEGTINTWLVSVGDTVNQYDPIAEVATDKVNAEVPSSFTGKITEIIAAEGETVAVGDLICLIETDTGSATAAEMPGAESVEAKQPEVAAETDTSMKKRYSPAVLRLAQEHGIELEQITGTGMGGRVTRKDIEKAISEPRPASTTTMKPEHNEETKRAPQQSVPAEVVGSNIESGPRDIEIPVKGVRKVIADHMVQSQQEIPHAWMMIEADVTNLVNYRNKIKTKFKAQEGYNLTFFAFFVKAVAQALKEFPALNSTWGGNRIIQHGDINLSFAVAKDDELFVPVIRNADDLSIKGVAREIHELAGRARAGNLTTRDIEGGTFTVNNTGSFGSVQSMGIINHPQAAILQVESIVKRPVIINDMFAARDMVNLCLSLDHRILDGLICGKFMARVKEILENISEETANVF